MHGDMSEKVIASDGPRSEPSPISSESRSYMRGDLTQGSILKTLLIFSIPILIANVIQLLNGFINVMWLGRLLGENAVAATIGAGSLVFAATALVSGFGTATTIRIGQCFGSRNINEARQAFGSGLGICLIISIALTAIVGLSIPQFLRLLETPPESFELAKSYLQVMLLNVPIAAIGMVLGMGLRGVGDSVTPLYSMALTVLLDITLNPIFILGLGPLPELGIEGSALATVVSSAAGTLLLLVMIYRRDLPLRLKARELLFLIPGRSHLHYIIGKGLPLSAQMLLMASAHMIFIGLVNQEGASTTAAFGISLQLLAMLDLPALAISTGVSVMVAQNIGVKQHQRVWEVTKTGVKTILLITGLIAVILVLSAPVLIGIFIDKTTSAFHIAQHVIHLITFSAVVGGVSMVLGGTMRAYGIVMWPLVLQAIGLYPVRLGIYFGMYPIIGSDALWWSYVAAAVLAMLMNVLLYFWTTWRPHMVPSHMAPVLKSENAA